MTLFPALLNGAILSALISVVVWVGLWLAPRRAWNAATRYGVWWAAFAAAVLLPLLYGAPALWHGTQGMAGTAKAGPNVAFPGSLRPRNDAPGRVAAGSEVAARAHFSQPVPWFPVRIAAGRWPGWILRAWALAAVLMLMRLLASYALLQRRKRRAMDAPAHLAARVDDWTARCGCPGLSVRLAASSEIATPMLAGLVRPSILIPAHLVELLDADEIGQIGLHEVAHLARGDDYALMVQRIAEAVFVLHPVVRWIGRMLDLEREIACDDFVLQATGQARPYAACLVRLVELTGGGRGSLTAAAAVAESRSHLSRRVDMLLDGARHTGTRLLKVRLTAAVAAIGVLAGLASLAPRLLAFAPAVMPAPVEPARGVPDSPAPAPVAPELPQRAPQSPAVQPEGPPVKVAVSVLDPRNRYVTGLGAENFRVLEDGVSQKITGFSTQELPLSLGILFDTSGSMRARLADAQAAMAQFLDTANPVSQTFLVTYNQAASVAESFTPDAGRIKNRAGLVQPTGGTSLREAIVMGLQEMRNAPYPNKALLIVSDGGPDNSSGVSTQDVEDAVNAAGTAIYAISFPAPGIADTSRSLTYLDAITARTGGQHFVVASGSPLPGAAVGMALRNVYTIEYRSTNSAHDGRYRALRVEALAPTGLPPLQVIYRPGYYAADH